MLSQLNSGHSFFCPSQSGGHYAPLTHLLPPSGLVRGDQAWLLPRWPWDLTPHLLCSHDLLGSQHLPA